MNRRITRLHALIGAAALLCVLVVPLTATGSVGGSGGPEATASGVKKQVKKLKKRVNALEDEQGSPRPPAGPAGADLAGTYPNPLIAGNAVGSAEVVANSLRGGDINESTLNGVGLRNIHFVVDDPPTSDSSPTNSEDVDCPPGQVATGGGAEVVSTAGIAGLALTVSRPKPGGTGWQVNAQEVNSNDNNWKVTPYVLCGTP